MAKPTISSEAVLRAQRPGWRGVLRSGAVVLLVVLAGLGVGAWIMTSWAERQILNVDNWVALVGPLPKQDVVAAALGGYVTDRVYDQAAVQQRVAAALPEQAAFLAAPIASQLESLTGKISRQVVQSDAFETVWSGANRVAMSRLLARARDQTGVIQDKVSERFNIDLSAVLPALRERLGSAAEALPGLRPGSGRVIQVTADLRTRTARLRQYVQAVDFLSAVLPLGVAAALLWALALARQRWRALLSVAVLSGIVILIELIALNWLRGTVLDQVQNPANLEVVGYVYDQLVHGLRSLMLWSLLGAVLIAILATLAGDSQLARSAQALVHTERLEASGPMRQIRASRAWVRARELYFLLGSVVLVLIALIFMAPMNGRVAANALFLFLGLSGIVHWWATPEQGGLWASA